ncbi:MAG: PAS domain S-box protein [Rhodothermales bacterium]|nr:PAS domain S-box protein [Rhodothermales bacterium]
MSANRLRDKDNDGLASDEAVHELDRYRSELDRTQRLAHVGTWEWNPETERLSWTEEVFAILGYEPGMFEPSPGRLLDAIHPEDTDVVEGLLASVSSGTAHVEVAFRIVRPSGEVRSLLCRAEARPGSDGTRSLVGVFQDITELTSAEEALEASEKQYQAILQTTVDGIITIDEVGTITSFNRAAEDIFGYSATEVIGENIRILMPEPYAAEHSSYVRSYLETGHRKIIGIGREVLGKRKNGSTFPMDLAVSEVELGDRRLFSGIVRDVSGRRQLEQQILRISEQERQRIGQDLHDGLGQMLTGIGLIAKNIAKRMEAKGLDESADMNEITHLIGEADEFARSLARGLIPVELDAGGLSAAFHRLATNARKLFDLDCAFEETGTRPSIDNAVATHLYRIAQEGLSNAVRHGQASQVRIALANGEEQLRLRLYDNGRGIPDSFDDRHPGMGIRIMRYRARIIGATLEVRKQPEGGTVVVCTLPIEAGIRPRRRPNTGTEE